MKIGRIQIITGLCLGITALLALACAPVAAPPAPTAAPTIAPAPTSAPPTNAPAPTTAPTTAAAQAGAFTLALAQKDPLGKFLADASGRTLYLLTKDSPNTSNCYDKCAQSWPPILSSAAPTLKEGLNSALVATTQRTDGTSQLTYNGWPLYYYGKDLQPGDVNGQAVGKVWWVISAEGNPVKPSGLEVSKNDKLGNFLADDAGRTVYAFTKDSKDTTVCYDKCEQSWPPLLSLGQPTMQGAVNTGLIGTIQRKDGTMQVTYNGMPLYYYAKDQAAGDVNGQAVGKVWFVVAPDGTLNQQAAN